MRYVLYAIEIIVELIGIIIGLLLAYSKNYLPSVGVLCAVLITLFVFALLWDFVEDHGSLKQKGINHEYDKAQRMQNHE